MSGKSKLKPFAPKEAAYHNFVNSVAGARGRELHCLEAAAGADEEGDTNMRNYHLEQADKARHLRQMLMSSVDWSLKLNCEFKHMLDCLVNTEEAIMRGIRHKMDVSNLLKCFRQAVRDLDEIGEKMYAIKDSERKTQESSENEGSN